MGLYLTYNWQRAITLPMILVGIIHKVQHNRYVYILYIYVFIYYIAISVPLLMHLMFMMAAGLPYVRFCVFFGRWGGVGWGGVGWANNVQWH